MLKIQSLSKTFGDRQVLQDIDLLIEESEIVAIMGSSGGGKTTLLRCISGLIEPTKGSVTLDNLEVKTHAEEARRKMGMVFQSAALFDSLNVTDNVVFGLERHTLLKKTDRHKVAAEALNQVGMKESDLDKMPSALSGGMRKRVGIARALALTPKIMLYDEPTTGLDPITTYHIDKLIVDIRSKTKMTSLLVSHDLSSVMRVADRVAFLDGGKLVFFGPAAEFQNATHPAIRDLIDKSRATSF
jgi:phospholipid/cholesterol/gamma-HCH transport system ATP-binding protein